MDATATSASTQEDAQPEPTPTPLELAQKLTDALQLREGCITRRAELEKMIENVDARLVEVDEEIVSIQGALNGAMSTGKRRGSRSRPTGATGSRSSSPVASKRVLEYLAEQPPGTKMPAGDILEEMKVAKIDRPRWYSAISSLYRRGHLMREEVGTHNSGYPKCVYFLPTSSD